MSATPLPSFWYALYTKSRAEKKVLLEFELQGIEAYLPLQRKLRQWSDRKKWVETPLISGYIFVHITLKEYDLVLRTPGVVTYVRFEGKAAIIPDDQIETIKRMMRQSNFAVEISHELFKEGDPVEVIAGPLIGMQGMLVQFKGSKRVVVQVVQLNLSVLVEVPVTELRKL